MTTLNIHSATEIKNNNINAIEVLFRKMLDTKTIEQAKEIANRICLRLKVTYVARTVEVFEEEIQPKTNSKEFIASLTPKTMEYTEETVRAIYLILCEEIKMMTRSMNDIESMEEAYQGALKQVNNLYTLITKQLHVAA